MMLQFNLYSFEVVVMLLASVLLSKVLIMMDN